MGLRVLKGTLRVSEGSVRIPEVYDQTFRFYQSFREEKFTVQI